MVRDGQDDVQIVGCNSGIDFEVVRTGDEVILTAEDGRAYRIAFCDWKKAVSEFSDSVRAFYRSFPSKVPEDESEKRSYGKFLAEWSRRRSFADED